MGALVTNRIGSPRVPAADAAPLALETCTTLAPCDLRCDRLPQSSALTSIVLPPSESARTLIAQGTLACVNDRPLLLPWIQVQASGEQSGSGIAESGTSSYLAVQDTSSYLAVQDFALEEGLGVRSLDSLTPQTQPVNWFASSPDAEQPLTLDTTLTTQSRYLSLSPLLNPGGWTAQVEAGILRLNIPPATVQALRLAQQGQGYRVVLEVDRPGILSVQQEKVSATQHRWLFILEGALGEPFLGSAAQGQFAAFLQQDPVAQSLQLQVQSPLPPLTGAPPPPQTYLTATVSPSLVPQVSRLSNPPRIVIDFLPSMQAFPTQTIAWAKGITWQQGWVKSKTKSFPVVWLTLDQSQWGSGFQLRPLLPSTHLQSLAHLQPLPRLMADTGALLGVNAGYFNRNNQLPLGAIRRGGDWISGPILNRGVVAWRNEPQSLVFDRLSLRETLDLGGQTLPLTHLNSGYVQGGMARYTPLWGQTYSPLIDGETVLSVVGNRVTHVQRSGKAGTETFSIPNQGYVLAARASGTQARQLPVGTEVRLGQTYTPSSLEDYPYMVGAGPLLVKNGQVVLDAAGEGFSLAFRQQAALRSAMGQTATGQILLVTIALIPGGPVPTLQEMAELMVSIGAIDAVNLDGGSSSSLYLGGKVLNRPPGTAARIHNGLGLIYESP